MGRGSRKLAGWLLISLGFVLGAGDVHAAKQLRKVCRPYAELAPEKSPWKKSNGGRIPILVRGSSETSFHQKPEDTDVGKEKASYDVVVLGGGLGGLTSSVYLTEANKSVLMLEKEPRLGGLAAGGERYGVRYARGAAYFSEPDGLAAKIFEHIGLADYDKRFEIPAPIDSYLWNGKLYDDVWEPEALEELPKSFSLFKRALELSASRIPTQPIEDSNLLQWDHLTAVQWIREFVPRSMAARQDPESKKLYAEFKADRRLDPSDPMKEVVEFLNLYCRSALGREAREVNATGFVNFYISEIVPRFTGPMGTGDIATRMKDILAGREQTFAAKTNASVTKMRRVPEGWEVTYRRGDQTFVVKAAKVIFAGQLTLAPELVEGFREMAPEHAKALESLEYAHYAVHNVFVKGHPWRKTYDLWVRDQKYTENDPTDIILGRWQDPSIHGYQGLREDGLPVGDDIGILTIYHPLPKSALGSGMSDEQAAAAAEASVQRVREIMKPMIKGELDIQAIETNRWPYSIHIVKPGHFTRMKIFNTPVQGMYFANNNQGLPSVEEAMYRGYQSAMAILETPAPNDLTAEPAVH